MLIATIVVHILFFYWHDYPPKYTLCLLVGNESLQSEVDMVRKGDLELLLSRSIVENLAAMKFYL